MAAFGLHGEVKVQSLTDNSARFAPGSRLFAGREPVTVAASRVASGFIYLRLTGRDDRNSAEALRHRILQVPEGDLPPLPEGEYYRFQLIGLSAKDAAGAPLGVVAEIIETGGNDVLRVQTLDGSDMLVPLLTDSVLAIDLAAQTIVLDPPPWR